MCTTQLANRLRLAVLRISRPIHGRRVDGQVSLAQISAVSTLHTHGPMTLRALADREHVQPPTMTHIAAGLSQLGFVDRNPDPADARRTVMSLSEKGRTYVEHELGAERTWLDEQIAGLDPVERKILRAATTVINLIVDRVEVHPGHVPAGAPRLAHPQGTVVD